MKKGVSNSEKTKLLLPFSTCDSLPQQYHRTFASQCKQQAIPVTLPLVMRMKSSTSVSQGNRVAADSSAMTGFS